MAPNPSAGTRATRRRRLATVALGGAAVALVVGLAQPAEAKSNAYCGSLIGPSGSGVGQIGDPKCVGQTGLLFRGARTPTCGDSGSRNGAASETGSVIKIHRGWTRTTYTTGSGVRYHYQWVTDLGGLQYGVRICKP